MYYSVEYTHLTLWTALVINTINRSAKSEYHPEGKGIKEERMQIDTNPFIRSPKKTQKRCKENVLWQQLRCRNWASNHKGSYIRQ